VERHPEKRMKQEWKRWKDREMPDIKTELPGLRKQQYEQKLWKLWQKAPENPFNKEHVSYNYKERAEEEDDEESDTEE
jgi:hypothetical protein